ncbi:MAG: SET domain-containing protein-lysine N-methyltransferase [Bacteroidota bacterium]
MILPCLYVMETERMGRGIFTEEDIEKDTVIEISPVIVMNGDDRKLLDKTLLHDYIFEWDVNNKKCCMALGYVSVYNHSYASNCEYEMDIHKDLIGSKPYVILKQAKNYLLIIMGIGITVSRYGLIQNKKNPADMV